MECSRWTLGVVSPRASSDARRAKLHPVSAGPIFARESHSRRELRLDRGASGARQLTGAAIDAVVFIPVGLITSVVVVLMFAYAMAPFYSSASAGTVPNWVAVTTGVVFLGTWYILGALYFGRLCAFGGRTLGMVATRTKLSTAGGMGVPGLRRSLVRWTILFCLGLIGLIPLWAAELWHLQGLRTVVALMVLFEVPLVADVASPLWTPSRRAWHDRACGVKVNGDT